MGRHIANSFLVARSLAFGAAMILVATALFPIARAEAYSYAQPEDPVVAIFQDGVTAAQKGDFAAAVKKSVEGLDIIKDHKHNGAGLKEKSEKAAKAGDVSAMALVLANIVYLSSKEKLEANIETKLADHSECKARLFLARKNYIDVLDGNIKRKDPKLSASILASFDKAMGAMGNPGLFGIGAKAPDVQAFSKAAREIEESVEGYYTSFDPQ